MDTVDKFIAGAGFLILVYLIVTPDNAGGVGNIIRGLTDFSSKTITVLQGR